YEEAQEIPLDSPNPLGKGAVGLEAAKPRRFFADEEIAYAFADRLRIVLVVPGVDAQRAAMGGQFLDVEEGQAVGREDPPYGCKGKIRVVLVVDGVELILLDQTQEVGKLHGENAGWREQHLQA